MSKHLETIEEKALNYLGQVSNPLVRIDVLHSHLRDNEESATLTLADLKDFLSRHDSFRVMEALLTDDDDAGALSIQADSVASTFVILSTRVPTDQQLSGMMLDQIESMHDALNVAMTQAHDSADRALMKKVGDALQRLETLRRKLTPSS